MCDSSKTVMEIYENNPRDCSVSKDITIRQFLTRNTLDCDQSNYSLCIVVSHIPTKCGHTGNSAI